MIYLVLIGLAGLFGLIYLSRTKGVFARLILAGQVIAIGLTFIKGQSFMTAGLSLYMLTLLFVMLYALTEKGLKTTTRVVIVVPTVFAFLTHFFQIEHYPGAGWLGLTMLLPIIAYIYLLTSDLKNIKNELGFLTIIAVDALVELARRFEWLVN